MRSSRGFTLFEVLIAMMILALTMMALQKGAGQNAENAGYLKKKTFAHWVAMNKAAEARLKKGWPNIGKQEGTLAFAEQDWTWEIQTEKTLDKNVRRLNVSVWFGEQNRFDPLVRLVTFKGRP